MILRCTLAPGADVAAALSDKSERPLDSVGEVAIVGPWRDLEERWRFFLSGVGGGF